MYKADIFQLGPDALDCAVPTFPTRFNASISQVWFAIFERIIIMYDFLLKSKQLLYSIDIQSNYESICLVILLACWRFKARILLVFKLTAFHMYSSIMNPLLLALRRANCRVLKQQAKCYWISLILPIFHRTVNRRLTSNILMLICISNASTIFFFFSR